MIAGGAVGAGARGTGTGTAGPIGWYLPSVSSVGVSRRSVSAGGPADRESSL